MSDITEELRKLKGNNMAGDRDSGLCIEDIFYFNLERANPIIGNPFRAYVYRREINDSTFTVEGFIKKNKDE